MSFHSTTEPKPHCPIKMSDGRSFTDYRPRCAVNAELMTDLSQNNMIRSSYESRIFLQENAEKLSSSISFISSRNDYRECGGNSN